MGRLLPNIVTHTAHAHLPFSILFIFFVFVARGTFLLFLDFRFQHTLSFPRIYTHTHTTFSPFFSVEICAWSCDVAGESVSTSSLQSLFPLFAVKSKMSSSSSKSVSVGFDEGVPEWISASRSVTLDGIPLTCEHHRSTWNRALGCWTFVLFLFKNFVVLQGPRLAINFVKHPTTKLISFFFFFP